MFSVTRKHTIEQKYYQTKLAKRMLCQIWQFQLRNTLKLSQKKKRNFKKSSTLFFKTKSFFLRHFDVVFHMFMVIKNTFNQYKNCTFNKTGEGNVVSDLAISPQKYPKIGKKEKRKMSRNLRNCFSKLLCFFYVVLTLFFFTCLSAYIRPSTKTKNIAGIKLEKEMWC